MHLKKHCYYSINFKYIQYRYSTNVGLMLGQRLRRWPNIKPTFVEYLVFFLGLLHVLAALV